MDLYPVSFKHDGRRWSRCRLTHDPHNGTRLWRWNPSTRTGELVYHTPDAPTRLNGRNTWQAGDVTVVKGCTPCTGAGPLARWQPDTSGTASRTHTR